MPEKRKYLRPVAWLGGRDLLANVKYFLLFAAFKGKLDPRDWMNAEVFPGPLPKQDDKQYERERKYAEDFCRSFADLDEREEFWFDYFADSGDGMTAGYAIAYLCMSDLAANMPSGWEKMLPAERSEAIKQNRALAEIRSRFAALEDPTRLLSPALLQKIFGDSPKRILKDYARKLDSKILAELERLCKEGNRKVIEYIEERAIGVVIVPPADADALSAPCPLPRGAFLFVGGDTSYHVADFAGLGLRFQKVFDWAFADLKKKFKLSDKDAENKYWTDSVRRPIFGVPGNHDYYDMIDGFNRQFSRPITRETNFINLDGRDMSPQLRLWPFRRFQTASYVAIQMPMGWWFWGIDSELTRVDIRQQEFFKRSFATNDEERAKPQVIARVIQDLTEKLKSVPTPEEISKEVDSRFPRIGRWPHGDKWPIPMKLIVATSEPTTVEGRRARDDDDTEDKTPQAFSFLGLKRPFLYLQGSLKELPDDKRDRAHEEFRKEETDQGFPDFQCRLDISGDVHHYARYWGNHTGENTAAVPVDNYASIVCGGGGASMSPTQTDYAEVEAQALYPGKTVSKGVINKQLFRPWVVIRGGNVWLAGLIIAVIIFFGATTREHFEFTESIVSAVPRYLVPPQPIAAITGIFTTILNSDPIRYVLKLVLLLILAGWAVVGSGLYARRLFERITKTHDWVRDKFENLRLKEQLERGETVSEPDHPTEPGPYEEEKAEALYQQFLQKAGSIGSLEQEREKISKPDAEKEKGLEDEYSVSVKLRALYKRFLTKTETQKNPGVKKSNLWRFWSLSFGHLVLVVGLWAVDLMARWAYLPRFWHAILFVALIVVIAANIFRTCKYADSLTAKLRRIEHYQAENSIRDFWKVIQLSVTPSHDYAPFWALLALPGVGVLSLALWNYEHVSGQLPAFGNSTSILFSLFVTGAAALVAIYYSKWLFDQSYRIKVNLYSYIPVMGLSAVALFTIVTAIARCGVIKGRVIITDSLYLTAILALIIGCIVLGALVGNHLPVWSRRLWFGLLGLWHGLLQLLVPFLLVWFGNGWTFTAELIILIVFTVAGITLAHYWVEFLTRKLVLTLIWFVFGALMLLVPFLLRSWGPIGVTPPEPVGILAATVLSGIIAFAWSERSIEMRMWVTPTGAVSGAVVMYALYHIYSGDPARWFLAGLVGAVMSCVWLGWYFAVALVFDGHANEAGSTARTEDYKHFIRFRLTEDALTGFVIGIDFPYAPQNEGDPDGSALKPRLIDVFTLKCDSAMDPTQKATRDQTPATR